MPLKARHRPGDDTEEGKKPRRQANGEEFKKKSNSRQKRGKEVAAMMSFDIFLRLAILCFLALR